MRKSLFLSIVDRVVAHDAYFVQRKMLQEFLVCQVFRNAQLL
jgi:hypothetical protein